MLGFPTFARGACWGVGIVLIWMLGQINGQKEALNLLSIFSLRMVKDGKLFHLSYLRTSKEILKLSQSNYTGTWRTLICKHFRDWNFNTTSANLMAINKFVATSLFQGQWMIGGIFNKSNWLISKRLGEQTTSTRPMASQKDDKGSRKTIIKVMYP